MCYDRQGQPSLVPRAGVVVFHPTTAETINPVAGLTGQEEQHHGFKLAQRGFVVICPRCFLWQDARDYREAVAKFQQRQPDARGMVKMLFDGMRAVDVLLQQPDVDPRRIGASGHSLGAKETLYLMAFDERVRAGVFSEGGLAVTASNWDAVWYLGPEIRQPACGLEHHQLVALIAPRPFLVLAGGRGGADNEESCRLIRAALPVYQLYTASARVGVWNHAAGHRVPPAAFERWTEWLQTYLP
ncbi:MAG: hypothetical protein KatS3mg114_0015 [Planctomycetaceae bacterium]|nr:MAG: hypothetical protein KatS3mg114_0015 [Planctomycetaceae bacterium]